MSDVFIYFTRRLTYWFNYTYGFVSLSDSPETQKKKKIRINIAVVELLDNYKKKKNSSSQVVNSAVKPATILLQRRALSAARYRERVVAVTLISSSPCYTL